MRRVITNKKFRHKSDWDEVASFDVDLKLISSAMRISRFAGLASGTDEEIQTHLDKFFPLQLDNHCDWDSLLTVSQEYCQSQDTVQPCSKVSS